MGWVRVDDAFYDHHKFAEAGPLGAALWLAGLAYCNRNLTDGLISTSVSRRLLDLDGLHWRAWDGELMGGCESVDPNELARHLVLSGLWEDVPGGYRVHDYHDYQPSAEQVRAERDKSAARKAAWRARHDGSHNGTDGGTPEGTAVGTPADVPGAPNPNPNPKEPAKKTSSSSPRATRLQTDFAPTDDLRQWASENTPGVNIEDQTTRFIDYWRGIGGQRGRKIDWPGTWRNWMRKAQDDAPARGTARASPSDQRAEQNLALVRQYAEQERQAIR